MNIPHFAHSTLGQDYYQDAFGADVPLAFEAAGIETDFIEGDMVEHTMPSGLKVVGTVKWVKFEESFGLCGSWQAFIGYERNGFTMTAYVGFDSLDLVEAVQQ